MSTTSQLDTVQARAFPLVVRVLGFPAVLCSSLALIVWMLALRPAIDPDIGWHLRNAEVVLHAHRFIRQDTYSFTTLGMPWIDHEWLAEIPYEVGWRLGGARGLLLVSVAALEAIFAGVFYLAWLRSGRPSAAWLATNVAALLATVSFGPRTLLFGWVTLVAELIVLAHFERRRFSLARTSPRVRMGSLWWLPLIFVLWVNLHGSWLIGFALLVSYVLCGLFDLQQGAIENRRWTKGELRTLVLVTTACFGCLFLNPYGWHLVAYPFDMAFRQKLNIASVQEWQALDWHSFRGRVFLGVLLLGSVAQLLKPQKWKLYELVYVALGFYAAISYVRFLFLAGLLILPLLASGLPTIGRRNKPSPQSLLNGCLLACMAICGLLFYRVLGAAVGSEADFPKGALPVLAALQTRAPLLNSYDWGGYLELRVPELPIMIDSRTDIFERKGVLRDYLDAVRIQNTFAVLDRYRIKYVLFEPNTPLVYLLRHSPAWKVDYEDNVAVLLERLPALAGTRP